MFIRYLVLIFVLTGNLSAAPRNPAPWNTARHHESPPQHHHRLRQTLDDDSLHRFDVLRYEPHLQFDLDNTVLSGYVEIVLRADQIPLSQIDLRLIHSLTIDSVWVDDGRAASVQRAGLDSVQVLLTPSLALGDTLHLGIAYHGNPAIVDGWGGFRWGQPTSWQPQIAFSMGDGLYIRPPPVNYTWFPCHADLDDKVLWEGWFRVPQNRVAVSGGVRVDTMHHSDGTVTWHYRLDQPVSTYLLFVAVSDYAIMIQRESGPRIENYIYPDYASDAQTHFSNVPAVLDGFSALFGSYPFDRFGYAMVRIGDMEHATCVAHSDNAVEPNHSYDWLLIHEMSHQWWGNWVTCGEWQDIWLNEGFATFCEALGMEILHGFGSYMSYMTQVIFPDARGATDSYSIYDPDYYWGDTVYRKGGAVMHMLRMLLGDSAFFQAWREYGQEHAFGNAVTAEWQAKLEEHYGDSLDWFFDPWVYGTKYPRYFATYSAGCVNTLTIDQIQPTETLFRMPIDVYIITVGGDTISYTVWNDAVRSQTFADSLCTSIPASVVIDPQNKILKTVSYLILGAEPPAEALPVSFSISRVFPNPFNAATTIAFDLPVSGSVALRVFDVLGREVAAQDLGFLSPGLHRTVWNGSEAASGIYLFRLETATETRIAKVSLIK